MVTKTKVVVLHGLWMNSLQLKLLSYRLAEHCGYEAPTFSYPTVTRRLRENTERLNHYINELDADRVHLVGHSLGGVLALQTVQIHAPEKIDRVVCLGSPLVDSSAARGLATWPLVGGTIGRTLWEGVIEKPLQPIAGTRQVGVIAGTAEYGLGGIVAPLESPHDGVVSVAETRLPGITDHITLPINHFGLVLSRRAARETACFLQHGKFSSGSDL